MKRSILILAGLAAVSGLAIYYVTQPTGQSAPTASETGNDPATMAPVKAKLVEVIKTKVAASNQVPAKPGPGSLASVMFDSAIDTLTSPHSTHAEKQAAWKQLQDSGRLADAAAELARRMADDPKNAEYPAALGQAYLKLCATSTDVRQQGIWAMTADQDFDTALSLDPSNWDARFTKAVALSYWPDNLNKSGEVIQQFNTLITQQEQEAPQPEFAQTYEWLGKEYQKEGQPDAAQQVWQLGAALYPNDPSLQSSLASSATAQQ
jgi:tetratricopeptide (TPR) repeat protein